MTSPVCPFFKNHPFSNWWMSDFVVDGVTYNCGEQWMMAQKALLFEDRDICDKILQNKKPDVIKRLGRLVKNFDDDTWNEHRYELVKKGLIEKFRQNEHCRRTLMSTGNAMICEASPYDKIWGIGIDARHRNINYPERWEQTGLNLLGKILMDIRDELK